MRMTEKITSASSYGTSGLMAAFGAVSLNEIALIVGIVCTLGTFLVNWYYRHKEFKRNSNKE